MIFEDMVIYGSHMSVMTMTAVLFFLYGTKLFLLLQQVTSNNVLIAIRSAQMSSGPKKMMRIILKVMVITFMTFAALLSKLIVISLEQVNWWFGEKIPWISLNLNSVWFGFFYYILLEFVPMTFLLLLCWHTHFDKDKMRKKKGRLSWKDYSGSSSSSSNTTNTKQQEENQTLMHGIDMSRGMFFNKSSSAFEENILAQMNKKKKKRKRKVSSATYSIASSESEESKQLEQHPLVS